MTRNELIERYTRRYLNRGVPMWKAIMYAEVEADDIIAEARQAETEDREEEDERQS